LSGTWGDTVNNSITSLLDSAIAGTTTLSADTTLTTTTGASNQARQAILLCTGQVANITITAPAQSKIYTVINASATYTVKIRGVGPTTGITIPVSSTATVAWNGSDFVDASGYINGNLKVNGTLTVTGVATFSAGTAALPAITTTGDTNTGIFFPAADTIAFSEGGVEAARIDSSGTFRVKGAGTAGSTDAFQVAGTAPASAMVLNSSGNLYLGAISSALANENILTGGQAGGIQLIRNVITSPTSGQSLGSYAWKGVDSANSNAAAEAMIEAVAAENFSGVAAGTNMLFYTKAIGTGPGSAPSERARISAAGVFSTTLAASIQGLRVGLGGGNTATSTAMGVDALLSSTGADATGFGYFAGKNLTSGTFSIAIGSRAMGGSTGGANTGTHNTAIGNSSLSVNTSGNRNIAIGNEALGGNLTGIGNVAIGSYLNSGGDGVLALSTAGNNNTAVGASALAKTTSSNNTAVGYGAGYSNISGTGTFIGSYAGFYTTGTGNTAVGYSSLSFNIASGFSTGAYNTAIGDLALTRLSSGGNNVAVGYAALTGNTSGTYNTALGQEALQGNTTGVNNTAVGFQAGYSTGAVNRNTFIGYTCGYFTTGAQNTFIGDTSGNLVTSGAANTILGRFSGNSGGLDIRTASNYIVLSDGDGNPRFYSANGSGNFFIGETGNFVDGSYNRGTGSQVYTDFRIGWASAASPGTQTGYISTNGTITVYNTTSDYRLKTVVGAITGHGERIDALEPIEYTWNSNGSHSRGFLAHKFQEVYADSVSGTKDAVDADGKPVYQAMQASTAEVIADLVAEIQSLRQRLADAGI
jgi:hypothetical protein